MTNPLPYIYSRQDRHGNTLYNACVRGRQDKKTKVIYLTTTEDKLEALAVAERYIITGQKPEKQKRGPKAGSRMPNRARAIHIVPRPGRPPAPPKPVKGTGEQ